MDFHLTALQPPALQQIIELNDFPRAITQVMTFDTTSLLFLLEQKYYTNWTSSCHPFYNGTSKEGSALIGELDI